MANGPVLETRLVSPPLYAAPPAPRFGAGAVVGRTLEVWWRHVLPFTVTSLGVYAPLAAFMAFVWSFTITRAGQARPSPGPAGLVLAFVAVTVVTVALAVVQAGAVTFGTVRYLKGDRARLGEMLAVGVRRGLPVVAAGFLVWLAVVGATLLLVVPGIVLMVATSVAVPAAVVERRGAAAAFRRSLELTRGARWPLFAAGLALVVVVVLLSSLAQVAAGLLVGLVARGERAVAVALVLSQVANGLFSAIPTVGIAVAYHDLRVAKEGVDTEALAKVFE